MKEMRGIRKVLIILVVLLLCILWFSSSSFEAELEYHKKKNELNAIKKPITVPKVETTVPTEMPTNDKKADETDLLATFINDPSFTTRCTETAAPTLPQCENMGEITRESRPVPTLMVPFSTGATTKGMTLKSASDVLSREVMHHPIFHVYSNFTATAVVEASRVLEFNGVHTEYDFDCLPEVDFRLYHQCRAALCEAHDGFVEQKKQLQAGEFAAPIRGQFPLVDEEYMEYIMTLTTAYDAARNNRDYTFIELGARYGTWIVRAGASFRTFNPTGRLQLLAVEGNCHWFQRMVEHVRCNNLESESALVLSYAAPRSYNKVIPGDSSSYNNPRAVSMHDMLPRYDFVDMIDFDIQGFEWLTIEEAGALDLMSEKIGFAHFGTHGTDIEKRILTAMQAKDWCVVYFYAGAHTKKLNKGHRCNTPYGPSVFNDGVLGLANLRFYPQLRGICPRVPTGSLKSVAATCYQLSQSTGLLLRD